MGLLKGHMPKISLNRNELTCDVQNVLKLRDDWNEEQAKFHGNIHKAITDTFQNPLLKKLLGTSVPHPKPTSPATSQAPTPSS